MAFDGYLELAGTEVANVSRFQTYVDAHLPGLLLGCDCKCDLLAEVVGDQPYTTPINDDAPWVDANDPDTWGFYGVRPLEIRGLRDGSLNHQITESVRNGGILGRSRHPSKEFRLRGLMAAQDDAAMEAGWAWMLAVAEEGCAGPCGTGGKVCFLSACPTSLEDMGAPETHDLEVFTTQSFRADRMIYGISYTSRFSPPLPCGEIRWTLRLDIDPNWTQPNTAAETGVAELGITELADYDPLQPGQVDLLVMGSNGVVNIMRVEVDDQIRDYVVSDNGEGSGAVWVKVLGGAYLRGASLTANTGKVLQPCMDQFLRQYHNVVVSDGPSVIRDAYPSTGGVLREFDMTFRALSPKPTRASVPVARVDRGTFIAAPGVRIETLDQGIPLCEIERLSWREALLNPSCRATPPPPLPPSSTPSACTPLYGYNSAYVVYIPPEYIGEWGDVVPSLTVRAGHAGINSIRARMLANPLGVDVTEVDPCSECASFALTYVPPNADFTVCGLIERAFITVGGQTFNGMQNLYPTRPGEEFTWPLLACGVGYILLVEIGADSAIEDLSLTLTRRE